MAHGRAFHELLAEVGRNYWPARRDYERAMRTGNQERINTTFARVQEIEACVDLRLKRALPT